MDKHFPHAFGWALGPAREAAGLTIRQLADKAGIHWVTVSALENRRKEPTTRTLRRLANALEVGFRFDGFEWSTGPVYCFDGGPEMTPPRARQIVESESRDPAALLEAGKMLLHLERSRRHCEHFGPMSRFCVHLDRFVEEEGMPTGRVHMERDELRVGLREALERLPALALGQECWFNCGAVPVENPWDRPGDPKRHAPGCRFVELLALAGLEG